MKRSGHQSHFRASMIIVSNSLNSAGMTNLWYSRFRACLVVCVEPIINKVAAVTEMKLFYWRPGGVFSERLEGVLFLERGQSLPHHPSFPVELAHTLVKRGQTFTENKFL